MVERQKDTSVDFFTTVDMSQRRRDFTGNIIGLYNDMIRFNANEAVVYLGKLHGFSLIYDGIILYVGNPEMDEKAAKSLRDKVLGKDFYADAFGNPLGTPALILVHQGTIVQEMWNVPYDFLNHPDHFITSSSGDTSSPDAVFDSLNELGKKLDEFRRKVSGLDEFQINRDIFRGEKVEVPEADKKRLIMLYEPMHNRDRCRIVDHFPLQDIKVSAQKSIKKPNGFGKIFNKFRRKAS